MPEKAGISYLFFSSPFRKFGFFRIVRFSFLCFAIHCMPQLTCTTFFEDTILSSLESMKDFLFCFSLLAGASLLDSATAAISCSQEADCAVKLPPGSECVDGFCTNPYFNQGCLASHIPDWHKTRICNSDDPPEAEAMGYCRRSPFDYLEIRALAQDWDTAFFANWVIQIILVINLQCTENRPLFEFPTTVSNNSSFIYSHRLPTAASQERDPRCACFD